MKTKLLLILVVVLFINCRQKIVTHGKDQKVAVHTFTGKGENDEATTWFYIKNIANGGFSGYYFESTSNLNNFKEAHFVYSKKRPAAFYGQYAIQEKVEFIKPNQLPNDILMHLSDLESLYQ